VHWFNNNANRHVKRKEPDGDSEIQEERLKPASARAQLVSATMKYKACDPPTLLESVYVFKYPKSFENYEQPCKYNCYATCNVGRCVDEKRNTDPVKSSHMNRWKKIRYLA